MCKYFGLSGVFVDEDNMASDSATKLATQQSIKAFVEAQVTAEDLDITSDSGTIAIDLDSETLTIAGGTGIDTTGSGNTITVAVDSTVATLTGSQRTLATLSSNWYHISQNVLIKLVCNTITRVCFRSTFHFSL